MLNQAVTPAVCARCGRQFSANAERILDVEKDPSAKSRLLAGRVNVARCPACGAEGALNSPFVYHDRSKDMLLAYMPPNFGANENERQRVLGDITNAVMNSLPPEQRKAYLFQPKMFFTLPTMTETILQADGVTKEMMDAQKAQVALINDMLRASDATAFQQVLDQNRDKIDFEFFQTLAASAEASQASGQQQVAQVLSSLSARLMQEFGIPVGEEIAGEGSKGLLNRVGLIKALENAVGDEELQNLVAVGHTLMDYAFFQELTSQIDAAQASDKQRAKRLSSLRAKVVQIKDDMEAESKKVVTEATELLRGALESENLEAYLRENASRITEAFFVVLSANMNAADQQGKKDVADKMERIAEAAMKMIQESAPPELQLLNRLMAAPYPDGTLKILQENPALLTAELTDAMAMIVEDVLRQGNVNAADKIKKVIAQIQTLTGK